MCLIHISNYFCPYKSHLFPFNHSAQDQRLLMVPRFANYLLAPTKPPLIMLVAVLFFSRLTVHEGYIAAQTDILIIKETS